MEEILQLLILAVLGALGGVLAGIVGVGGGIVFVPALVYVAGWDIKEAVAASFVIIVFSSLSGTIRSARKGAEDDDHEARRNGFFNIPPCHVDERRYENDTSPNPDDPRKNPAESPQNRQDKKLKNFLHRAILADKGYRPEECFRASLNPRRRPRRAPAPKEVDSPRENPQGDRVIQIVKVGPDLVPVRAQVVAEVGKGEDPRHAPNKGVEGELGEVHSGSPGGKGDKRAHHG